MKNSTDFFAPYWHSIVANCGNNDLFFGNLLTVPVQVMAARAAHSGHIDQDVPSFFN
jgi:hypothetical protein